MTIETDDFATAFKLCALHLNRDPFPGDPAVEAIVQALQSARLQGRREGMEEAAKIAEATKNTGYLDRIEALERALSGLEDANSDLAGTRSSATYLSMVDIDKASAELDRLDAARRTARNALKGTSISLAIAESRKP